MIKVAIVDDHQLFRKSIGALINTFDSIEVCADAKNGEEFLRILPQHEIDVVLLDIQMPVMDGYETCRRLRAEYPQIKVLMLSQLSTAESVHEIMEIGAQGFFTKDSAPEQVEEAIRTVKDKDFYFGRELGAVIKEAVRWEKSKRETFEKLNKLALSPREIEIIELACHEYSSAEIADKLFINVRTVETHRAHIMDKVGAKNFIGVVLFAIRNGLITIKD